MDTYSVWTYIVSMKRVAAAKFKEQCLSIIDRLDPQGIVITKHGRPVARVLPIEHASAELVGVGTGVTARLDGVTFEINRGTGASVANFSAFAGGGIQVSADPGGARRSRR